MFGKEIDDFFPSRMELTNLDLVVFRGSGILLGITLAADGGATGITLRDGTNELGTAVCRITALDNTTFHAHADEPILFSNGMFIDVDDANAYVTIQWAPLPEKVID